MVRINKNKKFIKESFSLQPKYVRNKFLNLALKFHPIKIAKEIKTITIVHTKLQLNNLNQIAFHWSYAAILIIGAKSKTKNKMHKNTKYIKNIESCILNLLSFCLIFNNF
ncbi:hypothetical protein II582_04770 [bacterium]|nr:hypothetical protein [bacterium]